VKESSKESVLGRYNALRDKIDKLDRTSNFQGLSPDLQFLWGVTIATMAELEDTRRSMAEILKALAGEEESAVRDELDDLEDAIKEDERIAAVRARFPNATNQSIG